ncbi:ATP-binding cassette domain-containing protein [Saccharibacillus sp. CPCC 101409]|uniref:ABC transporter ATP-binding protein/permease n=1 Tax=Saccharibacillus sp. CPCC 101409 TaxID=3058041 RepID=UPI002671160F|nr:ABC transporter ATP-binding protein/permease [Saccharibacillus sp. CPCC 101409]MDO3411196.1 ATP-binding cassette domain-containing protein [Saccharibacillus sp. CPCC 101409]
MSKLKLTDIKKSYHSGEVVHALKGVSLEFRESEFVSILGPSGCGKTTLLNIIGGLDRYNDGDLILGGKSTRHFKDRDWDAYRNRSIGFVFQNYNLIPHQTILQNVEISMTLSGISVSERREKARRALESVGLGDKLNKRPNQLSGGQMQRVAIARAIVTDPDIILADEPTGALDSQTSVQVMEILKKISQTKLVIMVTHNADLAEAYSSRIIHLRDGEVLSDSHPLPQDALLPDAPAGSSAGGEKLKLGKTSMSLPTAASLSFRNLLTKKGRTLITAFAGSIGIIGVALVLALSNGLSNYIANLQAETLAGFPLTVSETAQQIEAPSGPPDALTGGDSGSGEEEFPDGDVLVAYDSVENTEQHTNVLTPEYFDYVANIEDELPGAVNAVSYGSGVDMNVLAKGGGEVVKFETSASAAASGAGGGGASPGGFGAAPLYWQEIPGDESFILSMYDLIGEGSRYPSAANEVALVVNSRNEVDKAFFDKIGMSGETGNLKLSDLIGQSILKVVPNDEYYSRGQNGLFAPASADDYAKLYADANGTALKVTGILRLKEDVSSSSGLLSEGLAYTPALTKRVSDDAAGSAIAQAQQDSAHDVVSNAPFADDELKQLRMQALGADTTASSISIYPKDFAGKERIKDYLDAYNEGKAAEDQIHYTDLSEMIGSVIQTVLDTVSYVLTGFAAISLVVSTIMIGIITYVSVLERTKEIGILRSIGARKKDISRLFNAETLIVGFVAGALGISIAYLLTLVVNRVILSILDINNLAQLSPLHAAILVAGSMLLTLIAGLIPARAATKKDPVIALRSE